MITASAAAKRAARRSAVFQELQSNFRMLDENAAKVADVADAYETVSSGEARTRRRSIGLLARRFLVPSFVVSLYAFARWRSGISTRAEVELSPNLKLGRKNTVSSFTKIKVTDGVLVTGEQCGFGTGCFISAGEGGIKLGDHVICGPNVVLIASNYRYERVDVPLEQQGQTSRGVRIGNNVWIGANSVVLDGAALGDHSIVAAGSLGHRRFPPNSIIQGNPAKVILRRGDAASTPP
jgi:acetyltransferase-like isoleucine patch superfamily enzyme